MSVATTEKDCKRRRGRGEGESGIERKREKKFIFTCAWQLYHFFAERICDREKTNILILSRELRSN